MLMYVKYLPLLAILLLIQGCLQENRDNEWKRVIKIDDEWKFSIGDDIQWAEVNYDDSDWEEVNVPSPWEDEGYHGYDGYGWYRQKFDVPEKLKGKSLFIFLGSIDDVDEVYFNGRLIGFTGSFPPRYETAYTSFRKYPLPPEMIKFGKENTIAVRVYDAQLGGGIVTGDIGVYESNNALHPEIDLIGEWQFKTGDNPEWMGTEISDTGWSNLIVPGFWESQGFYDYDGYAWYRKEFDVPSGLSAKKLILLMGRIDDFDEVYLNGELVGSTGVMSGFPELGELGDQYLTQRNYFIKEGIVRPGKNIIAVRVYDGFKDGGIYKGPIGLITQERFKRFWKEKE